MLFVSYAHGDGPVAERLSRALQAEGVDVWFDQERLPPGYRWDEAIKHALDESDGMVVLVTSAYVTSARGESERVRQELGHAITSQKYEGRVFPIWSADVERSAAPSALSYFRGFELASNEPEQIAKSLASMLRER